MHATARRLNRQTARPVGIRRTQLPKLFLRRPESNAWWEFESVTKSIVSDPLPVSLPEPCQSLRDCRTPLLIGVRHHSAALARALPDLLDTFEPAAVLIELPADMADWIQYLADRETIAPVALSAAGSDGELFFYPLADFSPELVAIRWAFQHQVPIIPCDLAVGAKRAAAPAAKPSGLLPGFGAEDVEDGAEQGEPTNADQDDSPEQLLPELLRRTGARDTGQLWERLVETPSAAQQSEAVRQAALLFGWAIRTSDRRVDSHTMLREAVMRSTLREAPAHSVAVVGAFHAPALLPEVVAQRQASDKNLLAALTHDKHGPAISLVPYAFSQLDERSGYPAGIRDPMWHQRVVQARGVDELDRLAVRVATDICRHLREAGHVAGTPDATEITRMVRDLARLRNLPIGGRGELLEAVECCLVQGELFGADARWRWLPRQCWWAISAVAWHQAYQNAGWPCTWKDC